jgi:hypothetical protein
VGGAQPDIKRHRAPRLVFIACALMALATAATLSPAEDSKQFVDVTFQNATVKVGEKAVIVAKISVRDGLEITNAYRHRLTALASSDGVEFDRQVVLGVVDGNSIVFNVGVTPKRPGVHTVHGVLRFSYHYGGELDIRSALFEATVTATP